MKRTLYHGTSANSAHSIVEHGFCAESTVWTCSNTNETYFYDMESLADTECLETDTEDAKHFAIIRALESAQLTAAIKGDKNSALYVFEIIIEDEDIEVWEDDSCENMESFSCYCLNEDLNGVPYKLYECKNGYIPSLRPFYINTAAKTYINDVYMDEYEQKAVDLLAKVDTSCIFESLIEQLYTYELVHEGYLGVN